MPNLVISSGKVSYEITVLLLTEVSLFLVQAILPPQIQSLTGMEGTLPWHKQLQSLSSAAATGMGMGRN